MISNADKPLPIDHQLGEYSIKSVLGRGGFGITYLVLDGNLHKTFALKEYFPVVLATRGWGNDIKAKEETYEKEFEKVRSDFIREARILAAFKHPNIVSAVRVFEAYNTAYILMEYENGRSLQSQIENRHKSFSEPEVLSIFLPVLEGLEELHQRGFIHRDIKPDNIFIRENGTPVLIDFGAVRNFLVSGGMDMSIILTPHYAPIEQFTSDVPQGPYTDIYSLGCILYYLTTGRVPLPAVERMRGKEIESAESLKKGDYSDVFLRAIDLAMQIDYRKRPQTLTEWRKLFDPSAYHYNLVPVVENIQYKIFDSYRIWILDEFGLSVILHEAVLFSVILPLIDLEWRLQKRFNSDLLFKIYQRLIDQKRAMDILGSTKPERTTRILIEDVDLRSLFNERYRQYSASYLIDREQEDWAFKMTSRRFVKNVIAGFSTSSTIPDGLIQYGADLIDRQRGRVKRDLQKIDPRWGIVD